MPCSGSAPLPWRGLIVAFVASRILIFAFAAVAMAAFPKGSFFDHPASPIDWFIQWDADWFRDLINDGYAFNPDRPSNVNFLPLYPLLVRLLSWALPSVVAGYIVSNALLLAGAALLWRLTERVTSNPVAADAAVLLLLLGPVSFFFSTLYSEAAFLVCATGSLLALTRNHWWLAGLLGAGAALSRSVGLLMVVPLCVVWAQRHLPWPLLQRLPQLLPAGDRLKPAVHAAPASAGGSAMLRLTACALPALATLGYFAFLGWRFGEPRAYFISHHHAGHVRSFVWQVFDTHHFATLPPFYQVWFGTAVVGGVLLLLLGTLQRLPLAFTALSAALCYLYFSVKSVEAMPRFMSIVVPFYCTLGLLAARYPRGGLALLGFSTLLLGLSTALFVCGYWFT